jgi:SulP family sulfate permease
MGAWDFVIGIFVGIVLACFNFVVQTSQKSAIRACYTGEVTSSTVRRPPAQRRFLRRVGKQIHVTKLAGFLFFGTIVSVEKRIRAMLDDEAFAARPIRFLVFDMAHVTGIDFSAAEAFTRIKRILAARSVSMLVSSVKSDSDVEESLRSVGLWDGDQGEEEAQTFETLNSALEYCENELLKTLYLRRDALLQRTTHSQTLGKPCIFFGVFLFL